MKQLDELIDKKDEMWQLIQEWATKSGHKNEILPVNFDNAQKVILKLQVSTKSALGAVAYKTGGILVDNRWLRILGSGHERFSRNIISWNKIDILEGSPKMKGCLLIADDVLGGFFAINGGGIQGEMGNVFYFAPDTLEWEDMEMGYTDFIHWAMAGDVAKFYEGLRWNEWKNEVLNINCDQGILIYPFLWAEGSEITNRARKAVSIDELWNINLMNKEKISRQSD
ncbi:DUF2625 family protein [Anaerosinus massiliensis]|uniref:DUF2625 family protein n=1 Tax=Massilibacillus massiliensis TaxID=1806837 RepID=UPI000DA62A13|nr:DUF2625 family protein [Massilibacillus massiliensis]